MVSSKNNSNSTAGPPSKAKIVLSMSAFLWFTGFSILGFVYMSQKYSPRQSEIIVRLHSLTVQHLFHVQGAPPSLAKWEANITIQNHNNINDTSRDRDMKIIIRNLHSVLFYKDHGISCTSNEKPMLEIKSEKQGMVTLIFETKHCGQKNDDLNEDFDNELDRKMREERRRGHLRMSLKMNIVVSSDFLQLPNSTGRYWINDVRCSHSFDVVYVHSLGKGRMAGHDLDLWYDENKCKLDI